MFCFSSWLEAAGSVRLLAEAARVGVGAGRSTEPGLNWNSDHQTSGKNEPPKGLPLAAPGRCLG